MKYLNLNNIKNTDINLIPPHGTLTGNYVCTWWCQTSAAEAINNGSTGSSKIRDALNQEFVFDEEKYYHPINKEERADLIFLLDDGWDIPIGAHDDGRQNFYYGSVEPDSVKFSRFGDTPKERLKGMSDKIKEMGYAGLGIWISPQECGREEFKTGSPREYWETRAKWCSYAGILYWKVDWGAHDYDDDYRKLISECAKKYAPDLLVEHAVVQKPLSHNHGDIEKFLADRAMRTKKQMEFSDVIRTYDVLEPFDKVCTLLRSHEALVCSEMENHSGKGLINGENLYAVCAALGLTTGIMNYNKEALACINWQKIAPPFGIFEGKYNYSDEILSDTLFFDSEICEWAPCKGRTVVEKAPAIMSRGCPLPDVNKLMENAPYVLASKNPKTGAYSIATIPRTVDPIRNAYFLADITAKEVDPRKPIGVFGIFNTLTIEACDTISDSVRILAQDLLDKSAYDITEYATVTDNTITIDGKILRYIGKIARGHNDQSEPSVVIKIG